MSVPQDAMQELINRPSLFQRLGLSDWVWAALLIVGTVFVFNRYANHMDVYEQGILILTAPSIIALGWYWRASQPLTVAVTMLSLLGIWLYSGDYSNADKVFGLKYLLSSQSAVMWMSALFVLATVFYFAGLLAGNTFIEKTGSAITWVAITMGFVGLMVRWYESYLVDPEFGHIPVSNLYEVFILFCLITGMLYMYYEGEYRSRALGGFVLLVISAAVGFLLWYSFDRGAHEIQPLVPAVRDPQVRSAPPQSRAAGRVPKAPQNPQMKSQRPREPQTARVHCETRRQRWRRQSIPDGQCPKSWCRSAIRHLTTCRHPASDRQHPSPDRH